MLGPVAVHNHRRHDVFSIGDSAAFNLLLGLTDESPRSLVDDRAGEVYREYLAGGATVRERRAALADRLRALVRERGLLSLAAGQLPRQYFRLFDRESYFSAALPGGSFAAKGYGYDDPPRWLASALRGLGLAIYAVVLGAAPTGLARLLRERRPGALWALGWLVYLLALFAVLHVKARYRLALLPALALGAANAGVPRHPADGTLRAPLPLPCRLAGAGLGGALLVLAFGAGFVA
jgi:hypothetical protein